MRHGSLGVSAVSQYLFVDPIVNATRVAGKRLRLLSGGVNEERLRLVSRRHAQARFGGGQPIPTVVGTPAAL